MSGMSKNEIPMPESGSVVIAGDWHGNSSWMKRALQEVHAAGHRLVFHVGDLKVLWSQEGPLSDAEQALMPGARDYDRFTVQLASLLEELEMTLLFIDGNHDNHPVLRALPLDENGFGTISNRLKYIPRGHRFTIAGVRFAGLGGAFSIDRAWGTQGVDWWPEEAVTAEDVAALGTDPVDVLVTHEVPAGIDVVKTMLLPDLIEAEANESRIHIRDAVRNVTPKLVFSGHWHQNLTQQLPYSGTTVHVLDMDGRAGNLAVLDLAAVRGLAVAAPEPAP